jgi:hypothetical protein
LARGLLAKHWYNSESRRKGLLCERNDLTHPTRSLAAATSSTRTKKGHELSQSSIALQMPPRRTRLERKSIKSCYSLWNSCQWFGATWLTHQRQQARADDNPANAFLAVASLGSA